MLCGIYFGNQCWESFSSTNLFKPVHVVCVGLFDGLGGLRIALSRLGQSIKVVAYVSSEIDPPAKRLIRKQWPGVVEWGSILNKYRTT